MDFKANLLRLRTRAEAALDAALPPPDTRPARLHLAMRHGALGGGKRLRPILLLASAEAFAARHPSPPALPDPTHAAAAIEALHAYSLIHDDLPAMDDSPLRRGRATVHVAFDEATAILAGDALLTLAFERLATAYRSTPALASDLVGDLARAAGSRALCAGQMEDLLAEGRRASPDELRAIHAGKTGALFTAALTLGARLGGASPDALESVRLTGAHLGLAFQIIDDLLDATSTATTLGKSTGADAAAGKNTYVSVHGLDTARAEAAHHTALARSSLAFWPADTAFLDALAADLLLRTH